MSILPDVDKVSQGRRHGGIHYSSKTIKKYQSFYTEKGEAVSNEQAWAPGPGPVKQPCTPNTANELDAKVILVLLSQNSCEYALFSL